MLQPPRNYAAKKIPTLMKRCNFGAHSFGEGVAGLVAGFGLWLGVATCRCFPAHPATYPGLFTGRQVLLWLCQKSWAGVVDSFNALNILFVLLTLRRWRSDNTRQQRRHLNTHSFHYNPNFKAIKPVAV